MSINNLTNNNRIITSKLGNFGVLEYGADLSLSPATAEMGFFMSKMGVRRRQVLIKMDGSKTAVLQSGAMQWMLGDINLATNVKGVGDYVGKMFKGAVTKEKAVKPEYSGVGTLALEPTYKYIILQNVEDWGGGLMVEDGMFLACDGTVKHEIVQRKNLSSAILGGEGLFNLCFSGRGVVALESYVPMAELIEIELNNETLKIDGPLALCWSRGIDFQVEKSASSLLGSAISGEGFVNVFRGTGKLLMAPVTSTKNFLTASNILNAKP